MKSLAGGKKKSPSQGQVPHVGVARCLARDAVNLQAEAALGPGLLAGSCAGIRSGWEYASVLCYVIMCVMRNAWI